uniref:RNA-directed DNA polymerase n=1 Tax=Strongyloides papillosus TaxID=174720 RepID=A0A0N5B3X3_STREA
MSSLEGKPRQRILVALLETKFAELEHTEEQLDQWTQENLYLSESGDNRRTVKLEEFLSKEIEKRKIDDLSSSFELSFRHTEEESDKVIKTEIVDKEEEDMSKAWTEIDKFEASSGKSIKPMLERLKIAFEVDGTNVDRMKINLLKLKVCDDTLKFIDNLEEDKKNTFDNLAAELLNKYEGKVQLTTAMLMLRHFRIKNNPTTFRKECEEFGKLLDQCYNLKESEKIARLMSIVESDCVFNKLVQDFDKYSSYSEAVLQCECILKADANRKNSRSERKTFAGVCHHCQIKGHKSDECKFKKKGLPVGNYNKKKEKEVKKEDINNVVKSNERKQTDNLLLVDVKLNDKKIKALLDTGATKSIICNKVARDLNLKIDKNRSLNIATLGEKNLKMWKSQKSVNIKFKGYSFTKYILISDNEFSLEREYQLIIGNDILKDIPHFNELKKLSWDEANVLVVKNELDQKDELIENLKRKFEDVFSKSDYDVGNAELYMAPVELNGQNFEKPLYYPIQEALKDQSNQLIDELTSSGILIIPDENTDVEFISPTIVLSKGERKVRLVCDLRKLNKCVKRRHFPMPLLKHLLGRCSGMRWFTKLDQNSAFWQIGIRKCDQKYFGIYTSRGIRIMTRMPQGYVNSSAEYQAKISNLLKSIEGVINFIDDILIYWKNSRSVGMKICFQKCNFAGSACNFLGFEIDQYITKPCLSSKQKFLCRKKPETKKQLKSALASANYFRNHIYMFANITAPLESMLNSSPKRLQWEEETNSCWEKLREVVYGENNVFHVNFEKPFQLYCDASDYAIGSILCQDNKPINYFSRKLQKTARQSATFRELVSIVKSVLNFGPWLFGQHTTIFTDHSPLLSIFENTTNSQYIRLLSQIDSYSYDLKYINGPINPADFMSRLEENDKDKETFKAKLTKLEDFETPVLEGLQHDEIYESDDPWIENLDTDENDDKIIINVINKSAQIPCNNEKKRI